jgi:hypothetical protein
MDVGGVGVDYPTELDLKRTPPTWLHLPAMMRVVLSTPFVHCTPESAHPTVQFLFCPLIDVTVGYPQGVDRASVHLIAGLHKRP